MNQTFTFQTNDSFPDLKCYITTPDDFDPKTEHLPLLVFLHGAGERGEDFGPLLQFVGIPKIFTETPVYQDVRAITLSPLCPNGMVWDHLVLPVHDLILKVMRDYAVDPAAVSITGASMGGFGTWNMICTYPDLFSAAGPICGGGLSWRARYENPITIPVRAFHGAVDSVVPVEYSRVMVEAVEATGGNATLVEFAGVDHDSWVPAYTKTDLIKWLLYQRRTDKS